MKTPSILILCTALLVSMPSTDAQSFKDGLKSLGNKIGKQIVKVEVRFIIPNCHASES